MISSLKEHLTLTQDLTRKYWKKFEYYYWILEHSSVQITDLYLLGNQYKYVFTYLFFLFHEHTAKSKSIVPKFFFLPRKDLKLHY